MKIGKEEMLIIKYREERNARRERELAEHLSSPRTEEEMLERIFAVKGLNEAARADSRSFALENFAV